MNNKDFALLMVAFCFLVAVGYLAGYWTAFYEDFQYQEASIMTCDYANNLTRIVNLQLETLKLYTGTNYTALGELNCQLLRDGR